MFLGICGTHRPRTSDGLSTDMMESSHDEEMTDDAGVQPETSGIEESLVDRQIHEAPLVEPQAGEHSAVNGVAEGEEPVEDDGAPLIPPRLRSSSSRVASLRATFEQLEKPAEGVKRRSPHDNGDEESAEIARLKEELGRERDLRIAFEEKVTRLEEEVEELNSQLEEQEEAWRTEYEQRRQNDRHETASRLNVLTEEARVQRQEASNLQKQLSDLKKSVSASTRPSTHISDATFREEMGVLQHEMQNWIVQNFRRVKLDASPEDLCKRLESVVEQKQYALLQPVYATFQSAAKLPILQVTMTCLLMEVFDEPYLYGLHGQVEWADRSRQAAEGLLSILEPSAYNRCRSVTFDALRQAESNKALVEQSAEAISEKILKVLDTMTEAEASDARLASLTTIMKRAINLAQLIRVQQAKYEVVLPAAGDSYDGATMDDALEEGDDDAEMTIKFATFPAILKTTDAEGNHVDTKSVIVKAIVLCNASED